MKYKKIMISLFTMSILLSSCTNKVESKTTANSKQSEDTSYIFESVEREETSEEENVTIESGNIIQEEESKFPIAELKINKANIYDMNSVIETEGIDTFGVDRKMEFKINKVNISEVLPEGITKDQVLYFNENTDENGRLLNKKYIYIELLVKINCDKENIYFASSGNFIEMNSDGNVIDSCSEVRYQNYYDPVTQSAKDGNKIYFEPNEEKLIKIIYISNASMAESKDLYYMIDTEGSTYSKDIKAFKIDN